MSQGGAVVDHHSCDFFPERWFDLVVVLQADNSILYDRLASRYPILDHVLYLLGSLAQFPFVVAEKKKSFFHMAHLLAAQLVWLSYDYAGVTRVESSGTTWNAK